MDPLKVRKRTRTEHIMFDSGSFVAEMGGCHSCTQHPVLLKMAILYHKKSFMSMVSHGSIYGNTHLQGNVPRCIYQLYRLPRQHLHIILVLSAPVLIIDGFDPRSAHLFEGMLNHFCNFFRVPPVRTKILTGGTLELT